MREDSRALLKLLLESGQSYDDVAEVLGSDSDSVRDRARDALAELGGERPDPELTDYLLGEASPVDRADMARRLSADEAEAARAGELAAKLREVAPAAELPALPETAGKPEAEADEAPGDDDGVRDRARQTRLVLAVAALAILVAGLVIVVSGGLGGDDDEGDGGQAKTGPSLEDLDAVPVKLAPSGDSDASGQAVLGLATTDQPFVDLTVKDLDPVESSDAYIVWLMIDEERGWPLGLVETDDEGNQEERYPVPSFLLNTNIIKGLRTIVVSRSPRDAAFKAADKAAKSGVPEVDFVGEPVLSGEVPSTGSVAPQGETAP